MNPENESTKDAVEEAVPLDYSPYRVLEYFGNRLENVRFLLRVSGHYPLLIGTGAFPLIWISAAHGTGSDWQTLVERNVSKNKLISVQLTRDKDNNPVVTVSVGNTVCVRVRSLSEDHAVIDTLDLRPLGMNVYGHEKGLFVGNLSIFDNVISSATTAIDFKFE